MKKRDWIIVGFLVCLAIVLFVYFDRAQILEFARAQKNNALPPAVVYQDVSSTKTNVPSVVPAKKPVKQTDTPFAAEINLAVPFTPQAPNADWSQPYQDGCEEASVYMVHEYYQKNPVAKIDADTANKAILAIVAFEDRLFGFNHDTTVAQTAEFAETFYKFTTSEILLNPTIDQIKTFLNKGQPVIIPAAGQLLKNPYFTAPGPAYHMLVIRGYTKDNQFITNDPGTKRGQAYLYSFDTIMNAIHDWNGEGDILQGKKSVLVLHPKQ